jgi:hypothetical protein
MDGAVREVLAKCLPDTEPPFELRVEEVIRRGRRRHRIRTATPVGVAAVVVALAVGSVIALGGPPPSSQEWPPVPTTTTTVGTSSVPTTSGGPTISTVPGVPAGPTGLQPTASPLGTSTTPGTPAPVAPSIGPPPSSPSPQLYEFRAPPGHPVDSDATALTAYFVGNELPDPRPVKAYYGTRSGRMDSGNRNALGGHLLWQDGDRYGYLYWMHHSVGDFPVTEYGLPVEPCANPTTPAAGEACQIRSMPGGVTEVLFDVYRGYRLRGVTRRTPDPIGGADIATTLGFYLAEPGGIWPQFPNLAGKPAITEIPYTTQQLADILPK